MNYSTSESVVSNLPNGKPVYSITMQYTLPPEQNKCYEVITSNNFFIENIFHIRSMAICTYSGKKSVSVLNYDCEPGLPYSARQAVNLNIYKNENGFFKISSTVYNTLFISCSAYTTMFYTKQKISQRNIEFTKVMEEIKAENIALKTRVESLEKIIGKNV